MKDLNESNRESSKSVRKGFIAEFKEGFRKSPPGFPQKGSLVKRKIDGQIGEVYASDPRKDLLTVRWMAQSGQNTLICNSEQFARDWDLTGSSKSSQIGPIQGVITLLVVAAVLGACIYGCASLFSGPSEFKYPTSVMNHKIIVVDGNTEYDVTLKLREFDRPAPGSVLYASTDIIDIVKHELEEHGTEQSIVFHIVEDTGGGFDIYGRKNPAYLTDAFDIEYSMEDLKLINWDSVLHNGRWLLDLGSVSHITGAGNDAIRKYCVDEGFKKYAQVFCANY